MVDFVRRWGPEDQDLRFLFCVELRHLVNQYADAAIAHGARPEVGVPHGGKPAA